MSSLYKRAELVANICIIIVALLLSTFLVRRFRSEYRASQTTKATEAGIKPGNKLSLPGFDWSRSDRHLVLVLQKGCHFCSESAPFYQRLASASEHRNDLQLIAALPQDENVAKQYLNEIAVPINDIKQANPISLGVRGTPTLLLVDKAGTVTDIWTGKLPPEKETEVFSRLQLN